MLTSISIKNFQAHKETRLEFKPGVNLIAGASDNGKSSIIRALRWVVDNRPSGTAYRAYNTKEDTEVTLTVEEGLSVARMRGDKTNCYEVGELTLQALRTDVPKEVQDVLNIAPCSLQGQHDPYFLLQASPGEVAKKLSEYADLEIIHTVISNSTKYAQACKSACGQLVVNAQELRDAVTKTEFLDDLAPIIDKVTELRDAKALLLPTIEQCAGLIEYVQSLQQRMAVIPDTTLKREKLKEIQALVQAQETIKEKADAIQAVILNYKQTVERLNRCVDVTQAMDACSILSEHITRYNAVVQQGKVVASTLQQIKKLHTDCGTMNDNIAHKLAEVTELINQNPACPTCGKLYRS